MHTLEAFLLRVAGIVQPAPIGRNKSKAFGKLPAVAMDRVMIRGVNFVAYQVLDLITLRVEKTIRQY